MQARSARFSFIPFISLLATACPRSTDEPVVVPVQPDAAVQPGLYVTAEPWGDVPSPATAVKVQLPAPAVEFGIADADDHACARLDDGRVYCWGSELTGQRARVGPGFATRPQKFTVAPLRKIP